MLWIDRVRTNPFLRQLKHSDGSTEYVEISEIDSNITTTGTPLDSNNLNKIVCGDTQYGGTIVTDLNSINKSGFYTCLGTATGVPDSNYSWFVIHQNSNTGTVSATQRAIAYSTNYIVYERIKQNSTWGNWADVTRGWNIIGTTLTYSSSDCPTFVASTSQDCTSFLSVGMKIRLVQSGSTKYFFITAITSTTITLYGGTDYTLTNVAITNVYYSTQKTPYGFPLNEDKWTEILKNNSETGKSSPSANTWYNILSKSIPIGAWKLSYSGVAYGYDANENIFDEYTTLSTSNSRETDSDFTIRLFISVSTSSSTSFSATAFREKNVIFLTKTTVYLNLKTDRSTQENIAMRGDWGTTVIKAVCAYL